MMKRLRFATWPQILVMSAVWLGICLGIDFMFNPNMTAKERAAAAPPASVPLSVHLHHLRCKGCLEDVQAALKTLPWLQNAAMNVRTTPQDTVAGNFAGWLDLTVTEIAQIDFVALEQTLRQAGFVPSAVQFGGLPHFRLEGVARHLCSPENKTDCEPLPEVGSVRRGDRLKWLDSLTMDPSGTKVVFHVRFQQPNDRIDVKELFTAMDEFGLWPSSLKVIAAAE